MSFLIVPFLITLGYSYRVARHAALGRAYPPQYEDWGGLIVDGLRYLGIILVAGIVGLFGVFALTAVLGSISDTLGALTFFVGYFGLFYFGGAFLTAFIGSNSFVKSFTDGRAVQLLKSPYYLKSMLIYIAIVFVFSIITFISIITIIGPLIVNSYAVLAFGAYWGYVYFQATEKGIVAPPVEDQQPAPQSGGGGGARAQPRR